MGDEDVAKGMISQAEYFEGEAKDFVKKPMK